jgi:hydroxymethylglutaryl-CoA reductase
MNDHSNEWAKNRREYLTEQTGVELEHTGHYSIDPAMLPGNIENFIGVVQMPVGIAGPIQVNDESAQGLFYVPLATTEGTLVASYSRGMRVVNECGGVKTTVVEQFMQRAPAFIFADPHELLDNGDFYLAITLPSLIVATYGGGTGLPTQKECLEIMGCYGKGKANKLAEIVAATVLVGDISLACAVIGGHWVSSHDRFGRNRD